MAAENAARSTRNGAVTADIVKIGDRPAGHTDEACELVRLAQAALEAHGFAPKFEASSTDANIPMSLGIPAIKIGSGGTGGRGHSLEEWIDVEPEASVRGMAAGLATVLAVAGVAFKRTRRGRADGEGLASHEVFRRAAVAFRYRSWDGRKSSRFDLGIRHQQRDRIPRPLS